MEAPQENKAHHVTKEKVKSIDTHNIKAYGYHKGQKAKNAIAHQINIEQIRLFQAPTHKLQPEDPPIVVAVQGPPGCGKSMLIRSLIKHYSQQRIVELKGPITVAISKVQRITFIEVANDINSMIDAAKIADYVLLMVNAEHGFEMETFEFLNLLLSHGFPRVMGIITHLDTVDKSVGVEIKDRFRKELNTGIKVYKLEKIVNGKYEKKSIQALARLLNISKINALSFRKDRAFCLVDRAEKSPDDPSKTLLYGYSRGIGFKDGDHCHLAGVGDVVVAKATELEDPCPIVTKKASTRTLIKAQRTIHAPMSTLGGVILDDEGGGTIDLPINQINFTDIHKPELELTQEQMEELDEGIEVTEGVRKVREMQQKPAAKADEEEEEMEIMPGVKLQVAKEEEKPKEEKANPKQPEKPQQKEEEIEEEDNNEEEDVEGPQHDEFAGESSDGFEEPQIPVEEGRIAPGKYVKLEFTDIPAQFIQRLDPVKPIIIGTLFEEETKVSRQWIKIKKHRFYDRPLKSTDPYIISVGWRRFQTIPIYFNEDRGGRLVHLKYLKDLATNYATYYGPNSAINVGVTAFQHIKEELVAFRVSGTGVTLKEMGDGKVVKKLRVKGYPKEIHTRTAMIEGMFTSEVEANQFINAQVQTVSKIRGVIKAADKNGIVRCSFEDQIRKSDIVFINGWVEVKPVEFFSEIKNFVTDDIPLLRTYAEIRSDLGLRPQYKEDSVYKEVIREEKVEHAPKIPKSIKENLPYELRKKKEEPKARAVIYDESEAKVSNMFEKFKALYQKKTAEKNKAAEILRQEKEKAERKAEEEKMHKRTKNKQEYFAKHPKKGRK